MKKIFGIVLALALVLTMAVASAVPAAAVSEPITVCLSNPIAGENSTYCILFHNVGALNDTDSIDVMFPYGTNASSVGSVTVLKSLAPPELPPTCQPCGCTGWTYPLGSTLVGTTFSTIGDQTIRISLNATYYIEKCNYVTITVDNVTNPSSCSHVLEVGTSTHTPVDSEPYTIYCAKIVLAGGKTMAGFDKMNLISLPCYPVDTAIEKVLATLFCQKAATASSAKPFSFSVWYWDNVNKKWLKYVSDTSFSDLKTIEAGKTYWIKPSTSITIWVHGNPYPPGQGPPIKWCYPFCWNMVGFASLSSMNATVYLNYAKIPPAYSTAILAVWSFNSATQLYHDEGWPTDFIMTPGTGYWMAFIAEACIIPPAPS